MVYGLDGFKVGDNEADKNPVEATSGGEVGDDRHSGIAVAFEFVHGFGFSGWKKTVRWRAAPLGVLPSQ